MFYGDERNLAYWQVPLKEVTVSFEFLLLKDFLTYLLLALSILLWCQITDGMEDGSKNLV